MNTKTIQPSGADDAARDLAAIYDAFSIGSGARSIHILMANIANALRRHNCLSAIERTFFMVPTEPEEEDDGVPGEECLLNWGHDPAEYVHTFREALKTINSKAAEQVYLVATGETHEGQETYTRHDARPALCDAEVLYSTPTESECRQELGALQAQCAGLEASNGHLSALVDRHLASLRRAATTMKELHEAATPDESTPDLDARIPAHAFRVFVDSHAELLQELAAWNEPTLHPATAALVHRFAKALADKLAAAEKKYGYSDGWLQTDWMDECREKPMEHIAKGDPRDVAAYCAFLWHHGASTNEPLPISPKEWTEQAKQRYIELGDDDATATECAKHLCQQQDWMNGEIDAPREAVQQDVQERPRPDVSAPETMGQIMERNEWRSAMLGLCQGPFPETAEQAANHLRARLREKKGEPPAPPMECHGLDTAERVHFYEQDFYVLSNFSSFSLVWPTAQYMCYRFATSEQAYHWEKFNHLGGKGVQQLLDEATSAHEAFSIAQKHKALQRADWDQVKVDVMRNILRKKAEQHEYVRRKLLATGDRELVENSWRDDYWGWGPNRDGRNMLGRLWMEIRTELRASLSKGGAA